MRLKIQLPQTGRKRVIAAAGFLLTLAALTSAASFTDAANVNLGSTGAIGNPTRFDIGLVPPTLLNLNLVEQADGPTGYPLLINGSDLLVPGGTITTGVILVFNNSKNKANLQMKVLPKDGTGEVSPTIKNITKFLTFTATVDGVPVFTDVGHAAAQSAIDTIILVPRGTKPPLAQGAPWDAGDPGSYKKVVLTIKYTNDPDTVNYNGGQSALMLKFDASSVSN